MKCLFSKSIICAKKGPGVAAWLVLAVLGGIFYQGASFHANEVNTRMVRGDQRAYLNTVIQMHETGFRYMGDRNRMPFYHYLLAPLYRSGPDLDTFFRRGKQLNIALSLVLLGALYAVVRLFLTSASTLNLTLVTAFSLYIFRAGYVQCEILFYSLSFLVFAAFLVFFVKPSLKTAFLTGAVLAVAHLTKASVLPALWCFMFFYYLRWLCRFGRGADTQSHLKNGLFGIVVVITFLVGVFPYIHQSKQIFGRYFYNVNSTFYMWTDSWSEAKSLTRLHGDRVGWPQMPAEDIPSAAKYLREHSWRDAAGRVGSGLIRLKNEIQVSYGYQFFGFVYAVFALLAVGMNFRANLEWARRNGWLVAAIGAYFAGYLVLYAWAVPMNGGPRFILALFLPLMWSFIMIIEKNFIDKTIKVAKSQIRWMSIFHLSVLLTFCIKASWLTEKLLTSYSGN